MIQYLVVAVALGFLFLLSILPFFKDPYFHHEPVNFWQWALREILELIHGEK